VPIELTVYPPLADYTPYVIVDLIINLFFIVDIFIQFNSGFYDNEGTEIRDRKEIAKRYMFKGMFIFDLFSSIPYDRIGLSDFKLLKVLKITRIVRLTPTIDKMEMDEVNKAIVKIFKTILILFLTMHCIGCFWFFLVQLDAVWVPALDFLWVSRNHYTRFYDSDEVSPTYQYLVSLYTAVIALGGNEMGPRTNLEIFAMLGILLGLTMYNATIFGEMTVLVSEVNKKAANFQDQVDVANTAMKNMNLPKDAQNDVRTYLITTQGTQHEKKQLEEFMSLISPSLQEQVAVSIFAKIAWKHHRFRQLTKELAREQMNRTKVPFNHKL
jgi:hypothetical protein